MAPTASVPWEQVLPNDKRKLSIQSTAFPNVYLRSDADNLAADGVNYLLNLQVSRAGWERHELIQETPEGVFVIRSYKFGDKYVHLDPTVFPEQAPKAGTTFHPKGVGRGSVVDGIGAASRFQVVVNEPLVEGDEPTVSFKLVYQAPVGAPKNYYLRLNGTDSDVFHGPGSGEVNGQTYIGPFGRLKVERFP